MKSNLMFPLFGLSAPLPQVHALKILVGIPLSSSDYHRIAMAEIAGLALGVASLAGLFTTCAEFLDRVGGLEGSYQNKMLQFKACKHLFEEWGRRAGLEDAGGTTNFLNRLSEGKISLVYDILASIEQLFVDSRNLENTYGFILPRRKFSSSIGSASLSLLQARKETNKASSITRKLWWAVRDERKFQNLVSLLGGFTDRLYELVPVDDGTADLNDQLKGLRLQVDGKSDPAELFWSLRSPK